MVVQISIVYRLILKIIIKFLYFLESEKDVILIKQSNIEDTTGHNSNAFVTGILYKNYINF